MLVLRLVLLMGFPGVAVIVGNILFTIYVPWTTPFHIAVLMTYLWTDMLSIGIEYTWNGTKILKVHIPASLSCLSALVALTATVPIFYLQDGRNLLWLCPSILAIRECIYEFFVHHKDKNLLRRTLHSMAGSTVYVFVMVISYIVFFVTVLVDDRVKMTWWEQVLYAGVAFPIVKATIELLALK